MKVVIIGGGLAGFSCAIFLRKLNKDAEVFLIEKNRCGLYSSCALPYLFSGEIKRKKIFSDAEHLKINRITCLRTEAKTIDTKRKVVLLSDNKELVYDYLVLATGSRTKNICGFPTLKTISDYDGISHNLKMKAKVSIIGGGLVGIETAISLAKRGYKVKLFEIEDFVLKSYVDESVSRLVEDYLRQNRVDVYLNTRIVEAGNNFLMVMNNGKKEKIIHDIVICCIGFEPNIELAKSVGIKTNKGICVNKYLKTSEKNIYACGDCIEYIDIFGKKRVSMLASLAIKQAEIVAKNICGMKKKWEGIGAFVSKIGEKFIGSVGLTKTEAEKLGIKTISVFHTGNIYPKYYSDKKISYFLLSDMHGRIVGAQTFSDENVSDIITFLSLVIKNKMTAKNLAALSMPYHPLCSDIINPLVVSANILEKKILFTKT